MASIVEEDNNDSNNLHSSNINTAANIEVTITNIPVKCRFAPYWLNSKYGSIGMTALPGRSKSGSQTKELLKRDFELLASLAVTDIFLFCTAREVLSMLPNLDFVAIAGKYGIEVHHYPIQIGLHPTTVEDCYIIHEHMEKCLKNNKNIICISRNGFGRAPTILATFILKQKEHLLPDTAMEEIREYRGHPAIQTIKQYNFLHEYQAYIDSKRQKDNKNTTGMVKNSSGKRTRNVATP